MTDTEETICDHCGRPVGMEDAPDCAPDADGFCILCGKQIGGGDDQ